jgi:hypothetical protein
VLVSIITPVLNGVGTINACLASVAGQTYQPIEHIVVDGGSTDGRWNWWTIPCLIVPMVERYNGGMRSNQQGWPAQEMYWPS